MSSTALTLYHGPGGGQSVQVTATPQSDAGKPLTGRAVTWAVSSPTIVNVSATGFVTALSVGTATVTATSESRVGTVQVTVLRVPAAAIAVVPTVVSVGVGRTESLVATVRDSAGNALTGRVIAWSTSAASVAGVSAAGVVTGVAAGTATITAESEGRSTTVAVTVTPPPGPVIASVAPAILVPGEVATLTGTGFAPTAAENTLQIRGITVPVQNATQTTLSFVVPCQSSGTASIQVSTAVGAGPAATVPISTVTRPLARGESVILTGAAESVCNELPASGGQARYLVVVSSASQAVNTLTDFELAGNTPIGSAAVARIAPALARAAARPTSEAATDIEHAAHWERERVLYEQLRASGAFMEARPRGRAAAAAPPLVGDTRSFYYNYSSCADSSVTLGTKLIYAGTRTVIWEDTANVLQSASNPGLAGYYQRIGQIYDQDQHAAIVDNFGDPLIRDAVLDADQRIHMVFTQTLNGTGAAAYVTSCDMAARNTTNRAASNVGEFFYATVPTQVGSNINSSAFADGWFYFMARTVVHEVKHIASLSSRVNRNAPFEASWLEEGTARHAEEMWVRTSLHRVDWKGNHGYGTAATNGIYCDFNPLNVTCLAADPLRRPSYGMRRQFNEIRPKLLEPWAWSPYGDGTGQSGAVFYNTTWSLVRYAIDRYGSSDAAFLKALVSSSQTGMANLSTVAGTTAERLIGGWGLALYADDYPGMGASNPDVQFPTWNLRAIYAGLNADPAWSSRFNTPYPIVPVSVPFGSFTAVRPELRAGAHAFFEFVGTPTQPQLLHLRGPSGSAPSTLLRLAVVRLE